MAERPRPVSPRRFLQVALRSLHVAAMGIVLGGVFFRFGHEPLAFAIWTTLGTGLALFALDLMKDPGCLHQGSGLLVLLKLGLLGVGYLLPEQRFGWYFAATLLAGFGSHMPAAWRHYSLWHLREMGSR